MPSDRHVLEVGSGTGQHAVYLAPHFPWLTWHPSDKREQHAGIRGWLESHSPGNVRPPLAYEVGRDPFPVVEGKTDRGGFDVVFTANTLHIMPWVRVKAWIADLGQNLRDGARVVIYGPFNYGGRYTAPSNAAFDRWLQQQHPDSAIRDCEAVAAAMDKAGLILQADWSMPANNRVLVFRRK